MAAERYTWKAAAGRWLSDCMGALKPATAERYWSSLIQLGPILEPLFLDEIDAEKIAELVAARLAPPIGQPVRKPPSAATVRRDLTALSAVLGAAVRWRWRADNPAHNWDRAALPEQRERPTLPKAKDIDRVVAIAPRTVGLMIRFVQYTGMRQAEITSLKWRLVDFAAGTVELKRSQRGRGRAVRIDQRALAVLRSVAPDLRSLTNEVFLHGEDWIGEPYTRLSDTFARVVRRAAAAAKLEGVAFRPFRFHDLRHFFAVDYLRRGGRVDALQQVLGHASIKSTELYLDYLTPAERERARGEPE